MSKSVGNVIAPQKVMDTLGADILRLWVAQTDYSAELSISDEILKRVVESYRRIRNTLRFLLANIADFDPQAHALPVNQWLEIDRYAVSLTAQWQAEVLGYYDKYEFHTAMQKLQAFCSEDLGGFYLDILKDRLYTAAEDSPARRSAQHALHHIAHSLVKLMAPVLSFTAEEAWQVMLADKQRSIFAETWHVIPDTGLDAATINVWADVRNIRDLANKKIEEQRAQGVIGSSLQAELDVYANKPSYDSLARLGDDLRFVFITSRATLHYQEQAGLTVSVIASPHKKCERCWHYRADVGSDPARPDICGRCVSNLDGPGEPRRYA
jgi:isoleucyl-tRNA synthetase